MSAGLGHLPSGRPLSPKLLWVHRCCTRGPFPQPGPLSQVYFSARVISQNVTEPPVTSSSRVAATVVVFISVHRESAAPPRPVARARGLVAGVPHRDLRTPRGRAGEPGGSVLPPWPGAGSCSGTGTAVRDPLGSAWCPCLSSHPLCVPGRPEQHRGQGWTHPRRRPHHPGRPALGASPRPVTREPLALRAAQGWRTGIRCVVRPDELS